MPYSKVHENWEDLPSTNTPVDAAALDQIEQGIEDATSTAEQASSDAGGADAAITAHLADTSGAHDASAISTTGAFSNVQDYLEGLTVGGGGAYVPGGEDVAIEDGGTGASSAPQARSNLGLGTMAVQDATGVAITGGSVAGITDLAVADGGTGASTAADARTNLGLVIGTNVQAQDAELAAIAGLTSAADRVPYFTGSGTADLGTFTSAGRSMVAAADAAAQAALLGSEVYKQGQAVNAQTGTTYTLVAADAGKLVTLSNASGITLTLPQDSDATIAIGSYIDLYQLGAGQVTVAAGTGATLRTSGLTAKARAQYSRIAVQKVSANTWSLFGDLAAS